MATFCPAEKRPVIIQFGKCYTKVGFGAEPHPRAVFRTPELQSERVMELGTTTLSVSEWEKVFESLLKRIYFYHLQIVPSNRRLILIENDLVPLSCRESLSSILFGRLRVSAIIYLSEMITPLYSCGVSTGVVIDIGYKETRVLPVCFGVPIRNAQKTISLGNYTINEQIRNTLIRLVERDPNTSLRQIGMVRIQILFLSIVKRRPSTTAELRVLPESILEDIKAKLCYVRFELSNNFLKKKSIPSSLDEDSHLDKRESLQEESSMLSLVDAKTGTFIFESNNDIKYQIDSDFYVTIPAKARWEVTECLFSPPIPNSQVEPQFQIICDSIDETIIRAIEECPMDTKKFVIENILICGGGGEIKGLSHRLMYELKKKLEKHPTLSSIVDRLSIGRPDFPPMTLQWTGGSIAAATFEASVNLPNILQLEQWEKGVPIYDWVTPPELQVVEAETTENFLKAASAGPIVVMATDH